MILLIFFLFLIPIFLNNKLLFSYLYSEPIIPESAFQEVKSYETFFFSLNNETYEGYFKFKNNNNEKK